MPGEARGTWVAICLMQYAIKKWKFERDEVGCHMAGEGLPGWPYAFLSASGRPCTDANLTRCKREEILPQPFAGNIIKHKNIRI